MRAILRGEDTFFLFKVKIYDSKTEWINYKNKKTEKTHPKRGPYLSGNYDSN